MRRNRSHTQIPATFRDMKNDWRQDYDAAKPGRFRRTRSGLYGPADAHYADDLRYMEVMEYARDMERNDAIMFIVERAVINMVRTGFGLEVQTGDKKLDKDLWQGFDDWSKDPSQCDIAGDQTFSEIERMNCRREIIDGDIFVTGTQEGALQMFEGDRCRTPTNSKRNIIHGVELGSRRQRLKYYFTKDQIDPFKRVQRVKDTEPISPLDEDGFPQVFHLYKPNRYTQTRGITAFHAVFAKSGMFEDIDFALLVKQQMGSALAWEWQSSTDTAVDVQFGARETEQQTDSSDMTIEEIAPGSVVSAPKGKKLVMHAPNIPSSESMQHLKITMQIISVNIGMPLNVAMMDPTDSGSYSAWRGSMEQAKLGFITNQDRMEKRFHRPAYVWKVRHWMSRDAALRSAFKRMGMAIFRHKWQKPRWPYIDPSKDVRADIEQTENYLGSTPQLLAERGVDSDDVRDEQIAFNKSCIVEAIKAAKEIHKKTGVEVSWRDVYNRAAPKGGLIQDQVEEENTLGGTKKESKAA